MRDYDAVILLPLAVFQKSCRDMQVVGRNVKVEVDDNKVRFIAESETLN
nr:515_t:CDS:2 [Entrophospora candida]CAG8639347.1 8496_t:CDS:2 [Entrophospora candida]